VSERDAEVPDAVAQAGGLKRWLRPVMNLVAVAFVAVAARDIVKRWEGTAVELDPLLAAVACLPLVLSCLAQGFAWIALVERMAKKRVPRGPALANYLLSQLYRYTPGKVGLPVARMDGAPRLGLTRSIAGISVLVEMLSWTGTGAAVGFALLAVAAPSVGLAGALGKLAVPVFGAAAMGLLVLLLVDRSAYPAKVRALVAPEGSGPLVPVLLPLIHVVYWGLVAAHGYLMSLALGADESGALTAMGFYVVGQVAGFVVLAAPAGLGVREAVLVTGLTPSVGAAGAVGAAVISRALSLVAEIVVWAVARTLTRTKTEA
jgi:glycosyltransferase 2 family protein